MTEKETIFFTLEEIFEKFKILVHNSGIMDQDISIIARPLTPEEAIGQPGRRDFPIIVGKERIIEARFRDFIGQAFTDSPGDFIGTIRDIFGLKLDNNKNRAILIAAMNAVMSYMNLIDNTVHCKDEEPEECGQKLARDFLLKYGPIKLGIIGYNPAIVENMIRAFGTDKTLISDLYRGNIGENRFGVKILDGSKDNEFLIKESDLILVTGTTIQNNCFPQIYNWGKEYGKKIIIFGVTGAAFCYFTGIERICPCSR